MHVCIVQMLNMYPHSGTVTRTLEKFNGYRG